MSRARLGHKVALDLGAILLAEQAELLSGLHALGGRGDAQAAAHAGNGTMMACSPPSRQARGQNSGRS